LLAAAKPSPHFSLCREKRRLALIEAYPKRLLREKADHHR
jgi:hypothetical protein